MSQLHPFVRAYEQLNRMTDILPDLLIGVRQDEQYEVIIAANWLQDRLEYSGPLQPGTRIHTRDTFDHLFDLCQRARNQRRRIPNHVGQFGEHSLLVHVEYFDHQVDEYQALIGMRFHDVSRMGFEDLRNLRNSYRGIIGRSAPMADIFRRIELYARTGASILITGETGTGKELVARAVHDASHRRGEFVAVNCSAMTESLMESELFGHERGAFTGAQRMHRGKFERADRGTLFLDEIGEMALHTQAKLLRVLQDGRVERVGSEASIPTDARVVAATNVPLEQAVNRGEFRSDLFYRLSVFRLHLPPLRERTEDIPLLAESMLNELNERYADLDKRVLGIAPDALAALQKYHWPGNIRELANTMERLYIETSSPVIVLEDIQLWAEEQARLQRSTETGLPPGTAEPVALLESQPSLPPQLARSSREVSAEDIHWALERTGGNKTQAARLLGIDKSTLYRKMHRYNMDV